MALLCLFMNIEYPSFYLNSGIHVVWISFCLLGNSFLELLFVLGEEAM